MRYSLPISIFIAIISCIFYITHTVPEKFPVGAVFLVDEGESLRSISTRLEEKHIILSALWFRAWLSFEGKDRHLQLGYYLFEKPMSLGAILKRMTVSGPDMPLAKITIPEGSTTNEIAGTVKEILPTISTKKFLEVVSEKKANGYLFPSTYFLLPSSNEEKIVEKMLATFDEKYNDSFKKKIIPKVLKDKNEIISLSAILEGEAKGEVDKKTVSGILQKRLSIGMPLQVDVAPDTYKLKGVPSVAISNPGLIAIGAVFDPTFTDYLYYLTGRDGKMYYAKTFEEHKKNIQKYLR